MSARGQLGGNGQSASLEVVEDLNPRKLVGRARAGVALHVGVDDAGLVAQDRGVVGARMRTSTASHSRASDMPASRSAALLLP